MSSGLQRTYKIKRLLAQEQANDQKEDGGGGVRHSWGGGKDFSMKERGKPSYRIYIHEQSRVSLCK